MKNVPRSTTAAPRNGVPRTPEEQAAITRSNRRVIAGFAIVMLIGFAGIVRGMFFADPAVLVRIFDAGPEDQYAIGKVVPFPEQNVYLIGVDTGEIRAVAGLIDGSPCTVEWRPDDERGRARNPRQQPGVLVDPCSDAVWAASGAALSGTSRPLRTFQVGPLTAADGTRHVRVQLLGDRHPPRRTP